MTICGMHDHAIRSVTLGTLHAALLGRPPAHAALQALSFSLMRRLTKCQILGKRWLFPPIKLVLRIPSTSLGATDTPAPGVALSPR